MWDWRQLRWLCYLGWWPDSCKSKTGYRIIRTYGITLFCWDFVQLGPEFIGVYNAMADGSLKGTALNLNTTLMGVHCAIKIAIFLFNEKEIKSIISMLTEMDNIAKDVIGESGYQKIANYRRNNCLRQLKFLQVYLLGVMHWILRPLILFFFGSRVFIIESWIPWNTDSLQGWIYVYIMQVVHTCTAILGYILTDSIFMSVLENILGLIDILVLALGNLDFSYPGVDYHSGVSLRFCVEFHQGILLICNKLNKLIRGMLFVSVMFITIILCLSVFELTTNNAEMFKLMNILELIWCTTILIFMYCWYCHHTVEQLSVNVLRAAYNNNWYVGRESDKRSLDIICKMSAKKFEFGFIIPINLETFIKILKSAFSYFNFLNALAIEE